MLYATRRFGQVEVADDAVIDFPTGLIGLGGRRYALLAREGSSFMWLQSLEDPDVALPVTEPWRYFPDYELALTAQDAERAGVSDPRLATTYVTVRAVDDEGGLTANLRAPIIVVGRTGHQVINQAGSADVRAALAT